LRKSSIILILAIVLFFSGCGTINPDNDVNQNNTAPSYAPKKTVYDEKIGEFETNIIDKQANRVNNVKLACDAINAQVLQPGQEFSFNDTVGARTAERGYKEASIIVDGKKEKGIGGGICQVSTTLYNAAMDADLEILERHEHSKKVAYVAEGLDATVTSKLDLSIKNPHDFPVKFEVSTDGDFVTVVVYKDLPNEQ